MLPRPIEARDGTPPKLRGRRRRFTRREGFLVVVLLLVMVGGLGLTVAQAWWLGPDLQFVRLLVRDGNLLADERHGNAWQRLAVGLRQRRLEAGYRRFLRDNPAHARAMVAFGCFLYDHDREPEALDWWRQAVKVDPGLAIAHNNLAEHDAHHGRADDALRAFDRARALQPRVALYHYNWATICSLYRRQARQVYGWDDREAVRRSLEAFRRARDLAPADPLYSQAYAQTFYLLRDPDWEEARAAWQFCLMQELPEVERQFTYGRIARIYVALGQADKAREWLAQMRHPQVVAMREAIRRKLAPGSSPGPMPQLIALPAAGAS